MRGGWLFGRRLAARAELGFDAIHDRGETGFGDPVVDFASATFAGEEAAVFHFPQVFAGGVGGDTAGEGEIADVTARLAEPEVFERAGLSRPHALTRLRFLVVADEQGGGYIHVTSRNGIREPALEFIVEVSWRSGSLRRKYSVLLEPR